MRAGKDSGRKGVAHEKTPDQKANCKDVDKSLRKPAIKNCRSEGSGNDGVRHPCRRARGHCDSGDHRVSPPLAGAVGRDLFRHQQPVTASCRVFARVHAKAKDGSGQGTVEYAIVVAAFLVVVVGLGLLRQSLGSGLFVEHALASASHHLAGATGAIIDVFSF